MTHSKKLSFCSGGKTLKFQRELKLWPQIRSPIILRVELIIIILEIS